MILKQILELIKKLKVTLATNLHNLLAVKEVYLSMEDKWMGKWEATLACSQCQECNRCLECKIWEICNKCQECKEWCLAWDKCNILETRLLFHIMCPTQLPLDKTSSMFHLIQLLLDSNNTKVNNMDSIHKEEQVCIKSHITSISSRIEAMLSGICTIILACTTELRMTTESTKILLRKWEVLRTLSRKWKSLWSITRWGHLISREIIAKSTWGQDVATNRNAQVQRELT